MTGSYPKAPARWVRGIPAKSRMDAVICSATHVLCHPCCPATSASTVTKKAKNVLATINQMD